MSVEEAAIRARQAVADQLQKISNQSVDNSKMENQEQAYYHALQLLETFSTTILSSQLFHINKNMNVSIINLVGFYKENIERLNNDIMRYETRHSNNIENFGLEYASQDNWLVFKDRAVREKEILEKRLQNLIFLTKYYNMSQEDMKDVLDGQ